GAACNACEPAHDQAQIRRMATDGSGSEIVAQGVRRSLGLDFNPANKDLYFTDNGREWMSEDVPADELNRLVRTGQHYGFPYCHQGDLRDSQFGWGRSCGEFVKPLALLGPHTDVGGIHFYTGTMFPRQYRNTLFIVRKGAWSRTSRLGADILVAQLAGDGSVEIIEPFLTGFLEKDGYAGRPSDVAMMKDGSLLVSDEANGAIYRISFAAAARPARPAHAPAARPARTSAPRPARPAATTRLPPPPPLPQQAR
ncbi:MAG: PQQ-dependent sugar dehydrogenase, partial [Rhizobiales bacterium]|nr:PQQ-dependent sugar dehydrogenase [Hyphomicrobiales bacterium]